jgi:hypothetical protein
MRALTMLVVLFLAACAGLGAGSYRTGSASAPESKVKSKVRGFGADCRDWDQCEEKYGLRCMKGICTFSCQKDEECSGAGGVCVVVNAALPDIKACVPR